MRALIASGVVLFVSTFVGLGWFGYDDRALGDAGIGFGLTGAMAAVFGWAAFAPRLRSGAVRGGAGAIAAGTVAFGSVLVALIVDLPVDVSYSEPGFGDGWSPDAAIVAGVVLSVAVVGVTGAIGGLAARGYAGLPRGRAIRLVPAAVVFFPIAFEIAIHVGEADWIGLAASVVAAAWLVWALRTARATRPELATS